MIKPCSARSQRASAPRNVSAGPAVLSSSTPSSVPTSVPRPPGDGGAADDDGGDHTEFEADAGVGLHVDELNHGQHRRQSGERAHQHEHAEQHAPRPDAGEPRDFRIGAGRVDRASRRDVAQRPRGDDEHDRRDRGNDEAAGVLTEPEPLESVGQALHPHAFRGPAQRLRAIPPSWPG